MNTEEMLKKEKELEDKLFGAPGSDEQTNTDTTPVAKEGAPVGDVVVATDTNQPPPEQEREEDWKLRYTNLRNSRDAKLYDTQRALAESQATVNLLQQKLTELTNSTQNVEEDIFKDAFTDDEKEALGETAIGAMKKAAKTAADAKTAKINQELKEARERALQQAQSQAVTSSKEAYNTFLARLHRAVPDFQVVDQDPRFKNYMSAADIDGTVKANNFIAAEKRGDVATVARYMLDFKQSLNPKAQAKASLDAKINPTGTATSSTAGSNKSDGSLTMSEVNEHYRKFASGGYKGKQSEYLAMEARIDQAAASGKIKR